VLLSVTTGDCTRFCLFVRHFRSRPFRRFSIVTSCRSQERQNLQRSFSVTALEEDRFFVTTLLPKTAKESTRTPNTINATCLALLRLLCYLFVCRLPTRLVYTFQLRIFLSAVSDCKSCTLNCSLTLLSSRTFTRLPQPHLTRSF
jgi:hypothetical protein